MPKKVDDHMGRRIIAIASIVLMLLGFVLVPTVMASGQTNSYFKVVPSKSSVRPGDIFTVDIWVVPNGAIAGAQFSLNYNSVAMTVNSVTEGSAFKQGGAPTYFVGGTVDNVLGSVTNVADVITAPGQTISTQGIIASLNCTARLSGTTSNFVIANTIVGTKDGLSLPLAPPMVTQVSVTLSWDVDGNGKVDVNDLVAIGQSLGQASLNRPLDVNSDGKIDLLDLVLVAQHMN